jgi:nicotinamide mononucleotide transporter
MEIAAFLLSLICVTLNAQGRVLTWPFAIASSATYAWVFQDAKLFGDAALQLVFIGLAIYAWWCWSKKDDLDGHQTAKPFGNVSRNPLIACLLAWALLFLLLKWVLLNFTSSDVPNTDAFLTAGSLVATYMSAQKWLENWLVWAFVDLIYVGLYIYKDLYLTAVLYSLFIALCFWGWRHWSEQIQQQSSLSADSSL